VFQLRKQPQLVRQGEARQVDRHGRGAVYLPAAFFYRVLFFVNRSGRSVFRRRRRRRRLLKKKLFFSASSTSRNFLSESESVLGAGKCFQA
jgi:hypothetical protein